MPEYTLREIGRQAVANLGMDSGYELATQFAGQRYAELCSRAKFRHLREYGQIYLPAPINTGTCTVTLDSPVIVFDSTATPAITSNSWYQWPDGFTGLWFRPQIGITWYRIQQAYEAGGYATIVLETPYAYDNSYLVNANSQQQTGVTFYILPRYMSINPDARQLGVFMVDYIFKPLRLLSEDQLNRLVPSRFLVSAYPQFIAELNSSTALLGPWGHTPKITTGMPKMVEIYPYPTQSTTLHYSYWKNPKILDYQDYLPPTIDPDVIRSGAMADLAFSQSGKAVRAGKLDQAAYYRNIGNQELTKFEDKIPRAVRNDRGADDLKFIIARNRWRPPLDWDPIQDAFSNFIARGY